MSLMLEALRKAERQARREGPAAGTALEAGSEGGPVDALPPAAGARGTFAAADLALEPDAATEASMPREPAHGPRAPSANEAATPMGMSALQAAAPNARRPFLIALGVMGAVTAGAIAYFWTEMQPQTSAAGGRPAPLVAVQVATAAQVPAASAEIRGLPQAASNPAEPPTAAAPPVPRSQSSRAATLPVRAAPAETLSPRKTATPPLGQRAETARIHMEVQSGYRAFQSGEFDAARAAYQQALRDEPGNRDAMLGMAALEIQAQSFDLAQARYLDLLRNSPRDPFALAGLLSLRAAEVDPLQAESTLKSLLASNPDATPLHFSLGNQYARQERWAEARQAYARALAADPENPDFAFNLAVSLDRLHLSGEAAEHYRRALALAERRAAGFSPELALQRLQTLAR